MERQKKTFSTNPQISIDQAASVIKSLVPKGWVSEHSAFLVIHGIGNQNPLETLDLFGRGFIHAYAARLECPVSAFTVTHEVAVKPSLNGGVWFDNFIRVSKEGENAYIDLYEYYWANQTQDKASIHQIQSWVNDVVHQAKKFYEENVTMEEHAAGNRFTKRTDDKDAVTNESKIHFKGFRYKLFLVFVALALPLFNFFLKLPKWLGKKNIPIVSWISALIADSFEETVSTEFANVIGDIVIYNTSDAKSSFYEIRKNILDGAVGALRYLLEPKKKGESRPYNKVILVGHSLGTQIAYDAINRINHLVNFEVIEGIRQNGDLFDKDGAPENRKISDILCGLVTFGSPLDKIAFFLREHVEREKILMLQVINDYHSFRQRDWYNILNGPELDIKVQNSIKRLFENIPWRNYFDKRDYVSGSLDFYDSVINIDCKYASNPIQKMNKGKMKSYKSGMFSFTHSWYWDNEAMFNDIIGNFLQ